MPFSTFQKGFDEATIDPGVVASEPIRPASGPSGVSIGQSAAVVEVDVAHGAGPPREAVGPRAPMRRLWGELRCGGWSDP